MTTYQLHHVTAHLLTIFTTAFLGVVVLMKGPKRQLNRIFFFYSLSIVGWSLAEVFVFFWRHDQNIALAFARTMNMAVWFIPTLFLHLVFIMVKRSNKITWLLPGYAISTIAVLFTTHPAFIRGVTTRKHIELFTDPGPLYVLQVIFLIACATYGLLLLWKSYLSANGTQQLQLKYFFVASLAGYVGGIPNYLFVWNIPLPIINPYGTYGVSIYALLTSYAIVRYRLMDISIAITRTMLFATVYGFVLGLPFVMGWMGQAQLTRFLGERWWLGPLAASTLLASAGPFVYMKLQHTAEARLLREQRRYQKTLKKASQGMTHIKQLRKLVEFIVRIVSRSVGVTHASLLLWDEQKRQYVVAASRGAAKLSATLTIIPTHTLIKHLAATRQPLVTEELAQQADPRDRLIQQLIEDLRQLKIAVLVPSFTETKLIGCLALGDKRSGTIYSTDDLEVFTTLANQAAVAIENAQAFDALTHAHDQLKQAMTKLVASEKMAAAGQLATGLAHEIKNPLSAIRTFVTFLPERYQDPAFREKFTRIVGGEVDRINGIVQQLLNFAKPAPLELKPTNINQVIQETLAFLSNEMVNRRVEVLTNLRADHRPLQADPNQLRQVFLNLFLNSLEALANDGQLHVTTRDRPQGLEILVRDTGRGMLPETALRAFEPFYTTKDTGVGLGLPIVRGIVERHGGRINLVSQPHAGTTITIYLPSTI